MSAKIPKHKTFWIVHTSKDTSALKKLERAGIQLGQARERGAPNLLQGCKVPIKAMKTMDILFDRGEIVYGPE